MKAQDDKSNFNVKVDAELEALAKAYVQAANKRKISMTQANKIITQVWKENIDIQTNNSIPSTSRQIHPEINAKIREKIEHMVDEYPEFIYSNGLSNNADYRFYTISIISLICKMYSEKERIQKTTLVHYIRDYFLETSDNPDYCKSTTISCFINHIFETLYSLNFATTSAPKMGLLKHVDTSYRPTIYKGTKFSHQILRKVDYLVEADIKLHEYKGKKTQTITTIIYLAWFIETFF